MKKIFDSKAVKVVVDVVAVIIAAVENTIWGKISVGLGRIFVHWLIDKFNKKKNEPPKPTDSEKDESEKS